MRHRSISRSGLWKSNMPWHLAIWHNLVLIYNSLSPTPPKSNVEIISTGLPRGTLRLLKCFKILLSLGQSQALSTICHNLRKITAKKQARLGARTSKFDSDILAASQGLACFSVTLKSSPAIPMIKLSSPTARLARKLTFHIRTSIEIPGRGQIKRKDLLL
jgi:hypothetical protein